MKKALFAALTLTAAASVMAAGVDVATIAAATEHQVCDGGSNAPGTTTDGKAQVSGGSGVVVDPATVVFTRNGFDIQCSANVFMSFQEESANLAAVASGSAKGNQYFAGHTNGGAINAKAACTGTNQACIATDISTGLAAAITEGGSS